ncbi:MAG: hypothetical protein AB7U75_10305 [Hyphomicrobiaceae bacterium]
MTSVPGHLLQQIENATGLETLVVPWVAKAVEGFLCLTVALAVTLRTIPGAPFDKALGTAVGFRQAG